MEDNSDKLVTPCKCKGLFFSFDFCVLSSIIAPNTVSKIIFKRFFLNFQLKLKIFILYYLAYKALLTVYFYQQFLEL